jgi:hypothetical protein
MGRPGDPASPEIASAEREVFATRRSLGRRVRRREAGLWGTGLLIFVVAFYFLLRFTGY